MRKFKRKKIKRADARVTGFRFNLSVYNTRNRYKTRMRILALKKKSTPHFHFFRNKKNNYLNIKGDYVPLIYKEVPFFILRRCGLNIEKKKKYLKRKD
jgi:ERCC4-type nuclease